MKHFNEKTNEYLEEALTTMLQLVKPDDPREPRK